MATINSWGSNNPAQVAFGGTGQSTLTIHGVLIGNTTSGITQLAAAATGATLMGVTGANPAFTGSPSFSGSVTAATTITATSGAITATSGDVVITSGNLTLPATTASVGLIKIGGANFISNYGATSNTFIGSSAGNTTTTGNTSTFVGNGAGSGLTSAVATTGVGYLALNACTTGATGGNTAIGSQALSGVTTGQTNVGVGYQAGSSLTTSDSSNICINAAGTGGTSNVLTIGAGTGTGARQLNKAVICGIQGITVTGTAILISASDQLGIAVSSRRYKENIVDMADNPVMKLRPVNFNYKDHEDKSKQFGLIAEEVNEIMPELVVLDKEGLPQTVKYHDLPILLLKEIQKLRKELDELKARL